MAAATSSQLIEKGNVVMSHPADHPLVSFTALMTITIFVVLAPVTGLYRVVLVIRTRIRTKYSQLTIYI